MSETITYLELDDPAMLREPGEPPRIEHSIERVHDPELNRSLYEEVGAPHEWTERLSWSDGQWRAWADDIETWVATVDGEAAGYLELQVARGSTLISIFGLRKRFQGLGLGGALLAQGIRRGLELSDRVWVSTNTMDGEHALANYEARGMRPFKRETLA